MPESVLEQKKEEFITFITKNEKVKEYLDAFEMFFKHAEKYSQNDQELQEIKNRISEIEEEFFIIQMFNILGISYYGKSNNLKKQELEIEKKDLGIQFESKKSI